ncbi:MAG TPA: SIMPL domain-containing protein [Candidatus Aquilonibacter sp.]|nr:SIMPL domain-containing protein [Candidatus Aquilonibacter sp.]
MRSVGLTAVFVLGSVFLFSQDIQVNRQNKTIAITADESVSADAEVAEIEIGFHNFGPTQDAAFKDNVRAADKIVQSILAVGVAKTDIETEKLGLGRVEPEEKWSPELKRERQFKAEQSWKVRLPVSQAQAVVDLAVRSGANEVEDVDWNVADPMALQARAGAAALVKARAIAEQMAKGLGVKLGDLVYASNRAPVAKMWRGITLNTSSAMVGNTEERPKLTLFPQKVKSEATVYAVFAIE